MTLGSNYSPSFKNMTYGIVETLEITYILSVLFGRKSLKTKTTNNRKINKSETI